MKFIIVLIMLSSYVLSSNSQGVFSNDLNTTLQKIIEDYPNKFKNLKGEQISEGIANTRYSSRIQIPGTTCYLIPSTTRYQEYSWNCLLFESKDFKSASDQFKKAYDQIKNMIIKIEGHKPCIVNGHYEHPVPGREATIITFNLLPETTDLQKCKIELVMQNNIQWKVLLRINDQGMDADYSALRY